MQSGVNLCEEDRKLKKGFKENYGYCVIKAENKIKWISLFCVLHFLLTNVFKIFVMVHLSSTWLLQKLYHFYLVYFRSKISTIQMHGFTIFTFSSRIGLTKLEFPRLFFFLLVKLSYNCPHRFNVRPSVKS
jgi:hypothetical protein